MDKFNQSSLFDELEDHIQRGRLALVVEQNATVFIAANLAAPIIVAIILVLSDQLISEVLTWAGFGLLLCAARLCHHREFREFEKYSKSPRQWEFELIIFSMLSGLFWAACGILFISPDNPGTSVFIITTMFAHISAALASLSILIRLFIAFSFSLWLPACAFFLIMNSAFYFQISVLGSFFVLANLSFALNQSRSVTQLLRLQSENAKLLNEIKYQKLIADEANRAKSRFMATASHDLRQPLHAMGLFVDSLTQRVEAPETNRILGLLKDSVNTLRELFDSLLDISRLDAGVIKPQLKTFNLNTIVKKLLDEYSLQASNKGLYLRSEINNYWIYSDPVLIEQILRNLIWNAIKYTETGGVLISSKEHSEKIMLEIQDTGPGILEEDQQLIFEEFHQTNNPDRDRSQGIGLGLSIVKRTARLLNLDIGVRSIHGKGSKFFIAFTPIDPPEQLAPTEQGKNLDFDLNGVSVLVVDDEIAILNALEIVLQDWGCNVTTCKTIDKVKDVLEEFHPDILLTDFRLQNNETGDMVIKEVHGAIGFEIPSIIITGTAALESLTDLQSRDIVVLYKPLQSEELRESMVELLNL